MRRRRTFALLALLGLAVGCASSWKLRTAPAPPRELQWPYAPNPAKLTYLRSITGLTSTANAGSVLAAIARGPESADSNAFVLPVAVATAPDGRLAVADLGRACVHLWIPSREKYVRLAGSRDEPMRSPVGVAFDGANDLFVSDSSGRVYAFDPDGAVLFARREVGGRKLLRPTGIAFSPGRKLLYVVDTLAHTLYALDTKGDFVFSSGGRGEEDGKFNFPTHVASTRTGELVVADSLNFRIQILSEDGKPLASFGRHGDGSGDIAMPKGLAVDKDGIVYVADNLFDVVQLFDRRGNFLLTLGRRGTDPGEFWMPAGIFIDESGTLYVCDTYNHRIQAFRIAERYEPPAP